MFERLVVLAPQKPVSWNGYQKQTVRRADATDFAEATQIVIGMFQDVQGSHDIESGPGKRKILDGRHGHGTNAARPAEVQRFHRTIDADCSSKPGEILHICACATSNIQDPDGLA